MKKSYKTRGQGFTLIELLAVLVVLAILALIAIPIVIKVINNARENSYKRSIEGYARAAELAVAQWGLQHPGEAFPTYLEGEQIEQTYSIDYKGDKVVCQKMDVEEDTGLITLRYCQVMKDETEAKSKKYYKYVDSNVTEDTEPIVTYEEYNVGDSFTFGGANYHVISTSDASQDYVVALKDEPLTTDEVNTYGSGHVNQYNDYSKGTASNVNGYGGMQYYSSSTCGYPSGSYADSGCTTDYDVSEVKYVVDAWASQYSDKLYEDEKGYKARLISYDDLTNNLGYEKSIKCTSGCFYAGSLENVPSWVYSIASNYWTMTSNNDSNYELWFVLGSNGNLGNNPIGSFNAVRPVINVLKSAITKN